MERKIKIWLAASCMLVFCMIILGGYTRLSGSGLSMVDWKPAVGVIPPISYQSWQNEFDQYKQSPEYKVKSDMQLPEFKRIFLVEYAHRILARLTVLAFIAPFLYFMFLGVLNSQMRIRFLFISVLMGAQGLLGWYMVKSGLVDDPHVSHFRLASHLILASLIYGMIFSSLAQLLVKNHDKYPDSFKKLNIIRFLGSLLIILVYLQIFLGGLVAGLSAGLVYNEFPTMGGGFMPMEILSSNFDFNLLENPAIVQFFHRCGAYILFLLSIIYGSILASCNIQILRNIGKILIFVALAQLSTGVLTLLYQVPIDIALIHQAGAIILLSVVIYGQMSLIQNSNR